MATTEITVDPTEPIRDPDQAARFARYVLDQTRDLVLAAATEQRGKGHWDIVVYVALSDDEAAIRALPRMQAIEIGADADLPDSLLSSLLKRPTDDKFYVVVVADDGACMCMEIGYELNGRFMSKGGQA